MQVQETVTRPHITRRLGPAPSRMGAAATVPVKVRQSKAVPPRPLLWIAKRIAICIGGTVLSAYAFRFTNFLPIGIFAIGFPWVYWVITVARAQGYMGVGELDDRGSLRDRFLHPHRYADMGNVNSLKF
jgi:hypothetical protein